MKHPEEKLPDYALVLAPPAEVAEVAAHVRGCPHCQQEVRRYQEMAALMVDAMEPETPPASVWQEISARLKEGPGAAHRTPTAGESKVARWRMSWRRRALAALALAAVLLLGAIGIGYVGEIRESYRAVLEERRVVAAWLSRDDVMPRPVRGQDAERLGSLLMLPDGRGLFVLRDATEPGTEYQAWGHTGDELVSLTVTGRPVFEVRYQGFESLYLSLEPAGGSAEPTLALAELPLQAPVDW